MSETVEMRRSLERELPLLMSGLLVATLGIALALGYRDLRITAQEAAAGRITMLARQLALLIPNGAGQRLLALKPAARDAGVISFLETPGAEGTGALLAALEQVRAPGEGQLPIELWDRSRAARLRAGAYPAAAGAGAESAAHAADALPDSGGVGPLMVLGGHAYAWFAVPVSAHGRALGYVAALRPIGSATGAAQVATLLGRGVNVLFANQSRGPWMKLDGTPAHMPPRWPFTGVTRYVRAQHGETLAGVWSVPGIPWSIVAEASMASVMATPNAFLKKGSAAAAALVLLSALLAWLLSRSLVAPVKELGTAAEAIARGDYARRIHLRRRDELGMLAESFNRMAGRIQRADRANREQYGRLRALAERLEQTNARLESTTREAEEARRSAEAASRAKSEFLASISHEIRTPINAIIGYTDLLELELTGPLSIAQRQQLGRIRVSSRHLMGLVDEVLDFARIEAGDPRIDQVPAYLHDAVETALIVVRPQANAKGIEVAAAETDDGAAYMGDPQRVEQILVNLLSNAVKFTPARGSIAIHSTSVRGAPPGREKAGSWSCVSVSDTGIGIPGEQLQRIFEPFVQGESGYTRRHGGTGLGLAISQRLARLMGGELTVRSEPGAGSTFTLWLPAADAQLVLPAAQDLPLRTA